MFSKINTECQKVCIQIRPDILSGLIRIQTVCIVYYHQKKLEDILGNFACCFSAAVCQIDWIQIKPDKMSGQIRIQAVCIVSYHQKKLEHILGNFACFFLSGDCSLN